MSSVQTSIAQRKNKKLLVVNATGSASMLYTTAQLYNALNVTSGLSQPVQFIGARATVPGGVITDDNLGYVVAYATDADLGLFITKASTGLAALIASGGTAATVGETLRDLGRKVRVGTVQNGSLITFTQVQRTDLGLTTTSGVKQANADATVDAQTPYGVYWVVTESFSGNNTSSVLYSSANKVIVGVVPTS